MTIKQRKGNPYPTANTEGVPPEMVFGGNADAASHRSVSVIMEKRRITYFQIPGVLDMIIHLASVRWYASTRCPLTRGQVLMKRRSQRLKPKNSRNSQRDYFFQARHIKHCWTRRWYTDHQTPVRRTSWRLEGCIISWETANSHTHIPHWEGARHWGAQRQSQLYRQWREARLQQGSTWTWGFWWNRYH